MRFRDLSNRARCLTFAAVALLALGARPSHAQDCSDYGGVLDGFAGDIAPSQLQVDQNCTIRNFPASNPLRTNFSFFTQPGQNDERWLIVFDNVVHTGQMSCNSVLEHKIWFTNGSSTSIQEGCQNLLIPVEKIVKDNPAGQTTASVGVPFTYALTMPVLFDAGTGTVIDNQGSLNQLHSVTVTDDLNATGADLSYVSHAAYWEDTGQPVPHSFSDAGGLLTFDNFPIVEPGRQIIVELTVVLDATPGNVVGTQFFNTAKWDFGRLIDGVFYEPLPGEWGISPPMTIAGPEIEVTKTGPTFLNLGESGLFTLDVRNTGNGEAWDTTLVDRLPDGPSGGMCDNLPSIVAARVYAADGTTPVPGKGPLAAGTDFTLGYSPSPVCELNFTMLTPAATIGPGERLVIEYEAELDNDTENGASLTNVAGATEWFNGDASNPGRQTYTRALTNGTPGIADHEDAHTVTAALTGFYFEKTVANLSDGTGPAATAAPGDTLRYSLRLRTTDTPLTDGVIVDDLGVLNATAVFEPGSLTLVPGTVPAGAATGGTNPNGGTNGAGLVDIRNIDLPVDSETVIEFDVELVGVIANGTEVLNQAELTSSGGITALSDDPAVNGVADPEVDGDEDPTRILIESAPYFDVDKISTYVDGDPNVLMAGETLRYTITVANVGTADAVDAALRDAVPANTSYVAGSTTLNGVPVTDAAGGIAPLSQGIVLQAPGEAAGFMPAVSPGTPAGTATIVFDVVVDPDLVDGTVISNQAFVSAVTGGVADTPSDDPRTLVVDDPTRDVVGNVPLIYAEKSAALEVDQSSPGIVDPGDVLRYTITVYNNGPVPATGVVLSDAVPTSTTYVADSTTLNGAAVGMPDGGISPLVAGIDISSADLTPPAPGAGAGTLTPGEAAVIEFSVRVDNGAPVGTLITNQADVGSEELPDVPTDGDGNPATGPEPTVVVVGPQQQLAIAKQVAVVGGGAAEAGSTLEYTVRVRNVGSVPAQYITITDNLDLPVAGQLSYVANSALLNGVAAGITVSGPVLTADYGAEYGDLGPGAEIVLRFRAELYPDLAIGTTVTNVAEVEWNDPPRTASASVSIAVGGMVGVGVLSGAVWHDANFDDDPDTAERALESWVVELYRNGELMHSRLTDTDGAWRINGVPPNYASEDVYEIRFEAPGAGPETAALGLADSEFTDYLQRIADVVVQSGGVHGDLNLPLDPNGVVYNSMARAPVAGARLTLIEAASGAAVPASCLDDAAQQDQITLADGWYKFDLNFAEPGCPNGGDYVIRVTPPGPAYVDGVSEIIPPVLGSAPFQVAGCIGTAADTIPGTPAHCEVQPSELAPGASVAARSAGTTYYLSLTLDDSQPPGSAQIFNNHIPLDPELADSVSITKTTPVLSVTRGQLVPYRITVTNDIGFDLTGVSIVDRFPPGFRYVEGSARIDGAAVEPVAGARELVFADLGIAGAGRHELELLFAVGSGVSEGDFVNRAQVVQSVTGNALSSEATATVRLVPDPDFDCTDVMGKVYDDANRNGRQDAGEAGIAGIRLVTATGLAATTDAYGRYHITCATVPNEDRGSNFVLKLDDRTFPTGFRASTDTVRIERATRGKTLRFNFGASIHRVIGLDISDPVFVPGETALRPQWEGRIGLLLDELAKGPAVLRLSYLADLEEHALVRARVDSIERRIAEAWESAGAGYELAIEPEVFWRLGAPPERPREARRRER